MQKTDPVAITQKLIQFASITPEDKGIIPWLADFLKELGFKTEVIEFSEDGHASILNLYAKYGDSGKNFCFAGHTDVVPIGNLSQWQHNPFAGEIVDGNIFGRGVVDMKGAIAAFAAAVAQFVQHSPNFIGQISFLITGDEEAIGINGTKKLLKYLTEKNEKFDVCLIGEPTCANELGDIIKIGARGSANFKLVTHGIQGHVAYQKVASNAATKLIKMLDLIKEMPLDNGSDYFEPSNLEITYLNSGTGAFNVIPGSATALFNIRYNDLHTKEELYEKINKICRSVSRDFDLILSQDGSDMFFTQPGHFSEIIRSSIKKVTGRDASYGTTGATSDGRFIKDYAPVFEFGLLYKTAHKVDEYASLTDIQQLSNIYFNLLNEYFKI